MKKWDVYEWRWEKYIYTWIEDIFEYWMWWEPKLEKVKKALHWYKPVMYNLFWRTHIDDTEMKLIKKAFYFDL